MYRGRCIPQVGGSFCQKTRSPVCFAVSNVYHKFFRLLSFGLGYLDKECSEWLDSKPARSVIYVSLGSVHNAARTQVREMADGLMKSGCYFLWALRPDKEASHFSEMLPPGFIDECEGRGLIAAWFRQAEVLRHLAVGEFLSHCGWNAVIESVSAGVPMLGFPLAGLVC
ncbi:hypothetical protein SUGI_0373430 [Cryptomeria japonica]|nr:hypothetical protein SUGI_0373430 [Cryptomeria japonica]